MTKKEIIWRHLLHESLTKRVRQFTQKALAADFGFSLSTVFNALVIPRKIGAIEVHGRFFRLRDPEKLLYLWATHRHLKKDIVYSTHSDLSITSIESNLPPDVIFGAMSAYRLAYKDSPADYSVIYVYTSDIEPIKKRFPSQTGYANLIVLKADPLLKNFGQTTPDVQTFVDLWNIPEWYAKDFLDAQKKRLL